MPFEVQIVDLTDPDLDHEIYVQCLKLRRDVFISGMGWNLYQAMGCEFDQYDTPASIHVVAIAGGCVIGCMRLMRCDNDQGSCTYMILDAHRGRIPNLPAGILKEEIASDFAWEASRLAISPLVQAKDRNMVLSALIQAGIDYARSRGGRTLLGMMNPVFRRIFSRAGFVAYQFGPIAKQRDGRICVLRIDFESQLEKISA